MLALDATFDKFHISVDTIAYNGSILFFYS